MPLTERQNLMLHLAGTVRLPSPAPATGTVSVIAGGSAAPGPETLLLRLTHKISSRLYVERIVRASDVGAILAVWPADGGAQEGTGVASAEPSYKTGDEILSLAQTFAASGQGAHTWLTGATVYVAESAPVILRAEAGLTAAESADYYPPLVSPGRHKPGKEGTLGCDN